MGLLPRYKRKMQRKCVAIPAPKARAGSQHEKRGGKGMAAFSHLSQGPDRRLKRTTQGLSFPRKEIMGQ